MRTRRTTASKGQTALEFLVLTGFMMFVFSAFFYVMQERTDIVQRQLNYGELIAVAEVLNREAALANQVRPGYEREFELAPTINGEQYTIAIYDKSEVVITSTEFEHLIFLPVNLTTGSTVEPGRNIIRKDSAGVISIEAQ